MAFFDFLGNQKKKVKDIVPILPEEIYKHGVLELQDVVAVFRNVLLQIFQALHCFWTLTLGISVSSLSIFAAARAKL